MARLVVRVRAAAAAGRAAQRAAQEHTVMQQKLVDL